MRERPSSLLMEQTFPPKVHRNDVVGRVHKRRICNQKQVLVPVIWTVPSPAVGDVEPMWAVDRDYWVHSVAAEIGKHDSGTHPSDGTPGGAALRANIRVVTANLSSDTALLASDSRLNIPADAHQDAITSGTDSEWLLGNFSHHFLTPGMHVYPRISQVGSTRPGGRLQITLFLVPRRTA